MIKPKPIFIWAGGKTKMLKYHKKFLPNEVKEYSEPFFGGGAMFLYIMSTYEPKKAYINDINTGIMNIYKQIQRNVEQFCNIVDGYEKEYIPLSKENRKKYFYEIRRRHAFDYEKWDKVFEAATLYFLMKTGFNGIWQINKNTNGRYGTPSGLLNQKKNVYDKNLILYWNKILKNVNVMSKDYKKCPMGDLNYFDPPYRDSFTNYGSGWGDTETEDLIEFVKKTRGTVLLCNRCDGSNFFDKRKGDLDIYRFPVTYTAGRRKRNGNKFEAKKATEILLTNSKTNMISTFFE